MTLNVTSIPRPVPRVKIGDRIRIVRRDMDVKQDVFASELSRHLNKPISSQAIGSWESGRTEPQDKAEVCEALERYTGIPREWFMGWMDGQQGPGGMNSRASGYRLGSSRPERGTVSYLKTAA